MLPSNGLQVIFDQNQIDSANTSSVNGRGVPIGGYYLGGLGSNKHLKITQKLSLITSALARMIGLMDSSSLTIGLLVVLLTSC